jgi:hypothetical protein
MRHRWSAVVGSVAVLTLLSGCFGSGSQEPTTSHRTRHHPSESSAPTDSPSTSSPTTSPTTPSTPVSALRFSPRSGGKHLNDCQTLVPGDDPAEFLYYPVVVKATSAVDLDSITTDHTQGVVDAGTWVAPAASTPETGTVKGWPPAPIVTHDSNLRWSKRVPVAGATLDAASGSYNVFLRVQVDPTPGDSEVKGIVFSYHDASGAHTDTWVARTTFSMSC